ncbi:MAG: hypothetical protein JXB04_06710 [Kiritimatiellae bacterium]|nr:hypothetical protein [Kiritimatiellia bacterium]
MKHARSNALLWWTFALLALFAMGLGIRRYVLNAQRAGVESELPFTLESALEFRLVRLAYEAGRLPEVDYDVEYPEGVVTRETYTIGGEYVYAGLAHLLPRSLSLQERVRWAAAGWFCLGIPLMVMWLRWATGSRAVGLAAGAFYAVALSAVIRSTGQELSAENFALPLLVGHLALDALAARREGSSPRAARRKTGAGFWLSAAGSAIMLGLAAATWDMIQFYVLLWAAAGLVQAVSGRFERQAEAASRWLLSWVVLLAFCFVNPYMRAHAWVASPPMILSYGAVAGWVASRWLKGRGLDRRWPLVAALVVAAIGLLAMHSYYDAYGHFFDVLAAKIRFPGGKPDDPSLLTFSQRIMWVPALHSANWGLTWTLFPAMLVLTWAALPVLYVQRQAFPVTGLNRLFFFYAASLAAYCFFVRFQVFLALFASALLGFWLKAALERRSWVSWLVGGMLTIGWSVEAAQTVRSPWRWGRPGVYYEETAELVEWLAENADRRPVLANFGVSASILAYGKCPIILHPKFESRGLRDRVESYGRELFKGSERSFRDWAEEHGAQFFVYSLGEFARTEPERQMRYMVDALEPPADAPARLFEFAPADARYFDYLWGNRKYGVFRVISARDERVAEGRSAAAGQALARGDLVEAERLALEALEHDPRNEPALEVIRHVGSLRSQGFTYQAHEAGEDN